MADTRFFKKSRSFSVIELAEELNCSLSHGAKDVTLDDVSALNVAQKNHLSFLDNVKYKNDFLTTQAGACFTTKEMANLAPEGTICLVTEHPYKCYAMAAQKFYPETTPESNIAATAYIDKSAKIGKAASIGHNVVIGKNVEIGDHVWIEPNVTIQESVTIGAYCRIGSGATVSHAIIGDNVRLYPGVRVGQDGFGFAIDPAGHVKVPQLGRVIIHDHVEIGANTTIDRGAGPDTIIGEGTWIDNLVQIGHNVTIGRGCVIVAQVGISGSAQIDNFVAIGGQVGVAGHLKIGMGAKVGAQSGVISDLPAGAEYLGSPAVPKSEFFRQIAALRRLIKSKKNA